MENPYKKIYPSTMRAGWTVIELIFVIIIIGILAAIALGKLSLTRDDAKLSADVSNMSICITDTGSEYAARRIDYNDINHSVACDNVVCYNITYAIKGVNFKVETNTTADNFCIDIENVGGHLAKRYDFGGLGVQRR